ncbi:MAG: hypothetical protein WAM25_19810, partial [Candidatus Acidiferrales bacterium]
TRIETNFQFLCAFPHRQRCNSLPHFSVAGNCKNLQLKHQKKTDGTPPGLICPFAVEVFTYLACSVVAHATNGRDAPAGGAETT